MIVVCCSVVDSDLLVCVVCWVLKLLFLERCLLFVVCCLMIVRLLFESNVCLLHRVWCVVFVVGCCC